MDKKTLDNLVNVSNFINTVEDKAERVLLETDWLGKEGYQEAKDSWNEALENKNALNDIIDDLEDEPEKITIADIECIAQGLRDEFCTLEDDKIGDERDAWQDSVKDYLKDAFSEWIK